MSIGVSWCNGPLYKARRTAQLVAPLARATSPQGIRRLTVRPSSSGTNWLQWDAGENKRGTQYVVEVMNANTIGFVYVTTTSKQSFKHLDQQPGFQQTYRVYALRNGQKGIPSFPFTVYGPSSKQAQLDLKIA